MFATREDIRKAAGELVLCGFDGTTLTPELREILREVRPLGLILFARNIQSVPQITELNHELKSHRSEDPMLLAVDQEGGRVARVRAPATEWPPMRRLGEIGDPEFARRVGAGLAKELRAMNFDVDFAPVLDVDTNPKNPVIGDRSFSRDATVVAKLGEAFIRGMQGAGVAACAKHFPGHGDTDVDSHLDLPTVHHALARLREVEWPPFRAAIAAGVSSIMTAHVVVEELDALPATLSKRILTEHLRTELGFEGVIVSDDIEMKAVADRFSPAEMAKLGLQAGVDVFLACHKPDIVMDLFRGIIQAVEDKDVSHQALMKAAKRARAWRNTYYAPPVDTRTHASHIGSHAGLVDEILASLNAGA